MVGGQRMSEVNETEQGFVQMILNPSKTMSNWFVGIGLLGLFLAVLNLMGEVHPNYRVSWAGVLPLKQQTRLLKT